MIRLACILAMTLSLPASVVAQTRARADVACHPTGTLLQYDCTIALKNARSGEPLGGVTVTVGADMPSMPMMHNVRPVAAASGAQAGTYHARLTLEMHGDWALQLNLSGPVRDRIVTTLRFDPDKVAPAAKAVPAHKH